MALTRVGESDKPRKALYRCDCGREKEIRTSHVVSGRVRTCGQCQVERHNASGSPAYQRWCSMLARCHLPSSTGYHKYGKRGIVVCDRWRESFVAFMEDMGEPPSQEATIGRIDNDGPYSPQNCRWETPKQQANNRRSNRLVTVNGETLSLQQWSDRTGVRPHTIRARLERGWSPELAVHAPPGSTPKPKLPNSLATRAARAGLSPGTVQARIARGWSVERALTEAPFGKSIKLEA